MGRHYTAPAAPHVVSSLYLALVLIWTRGSGLLVHENRATTLYACGDKSMEIPNPNHMASRTSNSAQVLGERMTGEVERADWQTPCSPPAHILFSVLHITF